MTADRSSTPSGADDASLDEVPGDEYEDGYEDEEFEDDDGDDEPDGERAQPRGWPLGTILAFSIGVWAGRWFEVLPDGLESLAGYLMVLVTAGCAAGLYRRWVRRQFAQARARRAAR